MKRKQLFPSWDQQQFPELVSGSPVQVAATLQRTGGGAGAGAGAGRGGQGGAGGAESAGGVERPRSRGLWVHLRLALRQHAWNGTPKLEQHHFSQRHILYVGVWGSAGRASGPLVREERRGSPRVRSLRPPWAPGGARGARALMRCA